MGDFGTRRLWTLVVVAGLAALLFAVTVVVLFERGLARRPAAGRR